MAGGNDPRRIVVVGGGIAGLAAAHRLLEVSRERKDPVAVTLCEAGGRLGGTVGTERVDGFLLERGADSFITDKPWALKLCERLGLAPRLCSPEDRVRRVYVVRGGRLLALPEGFLLLAPTRLGPVLRSPLFSWAGKARMALDLVLPRRRDGGDESLGAFVRRRLGRELLERAAQPLVAGIYTADPEQLSLAATLPRFLALEGTHRSVILGLRRTASRPQTVSAAGARLGLFVTLLGGMGELVEALAARLTPAAVRLHTPVAAVERPGAGGGWRVRLAGGDSLVADGVILAGSAPRMAAVVEGLDGGLAARLREVAYASSAAVTLGYPREALRHPLDAFGYVVPVAEGRRTLACTFSSVKYPGRAPPGLVLLRVFLGGALDPDVLGRDDPELVRLAREDVAALLGAAGPPVLTRVSRYPAAMPQYAVGHLDRVMAIERRLAVWPGLRLAGAAYRGVGIADCVRSGEAAAEALLAGPAAA
jgi:oxygen-dependent protoporphyrinogen oxidase